jgi:hypothetical protein
MNSKGETAENLVVRAPLTLGGCFAASLAQFSLLFEVDVLGLLADGLS